MISSKCVFNMQTAKNTYRALTGAGVVIFMMYSLRIRFLPTGLSLSDVIFFLLVIISFSILLAFFMALWFSMSVILSYLLIKTILLASPMQIRKGRAWRRTLRGTYRVASRMKIFEGLYIHTLIALIGIAVIYLGVHNGILDCGSITLLFFFSVLFLTIIPWVYIDKKVMKKDKNKVVLSISGLLVILIVFISDIPPVLSDAGMAYIGVRKSNVTILLHGKDLEMARHLTGNQNQTFFRGDTLFSGVGSTSLLIINNQKIIVSNENLTLAF